MPAIIYALFLLISFSSIAQDNEIELFISRKQAESQRMKILYGDTKEIRYGTFIMDLDDTGKEALGLMMDAAERGKKVYFMIDDWEKGVVKKPAYLQALRNAGVEVRVFNPVLSNPAMVNYRSHAKTLIDDNVALIGGRNTKKDYFKEYIDVEALVRGNQVAEAKKQYDLVFNSDRVRVPKIHANAEEVAAAAKELREYAAGAKTKYSGPKYQYKKIAQNVVEARYYSDPPDLADKKSHGIRHRIIEMFDRAEKNLDIMNPYVALTKEEKAAAKRAIDRGVKIRISTNASHVTDNKLFGIAWDIKKNELVDMGIEVYESERYIHAKTIVRDRSEVYIGSFNLDPRSQNLNLENGIFFHDRVLAKELDTHQRRVARMFTTRYQRTKDKSKNILQKGGKCVQEGIHRLITTIAFPLL